MRTRTSPRAGYGPMRPARAYVLAHGAGAGMRHHSCWPPRPSSARSASPRCAFSSLYLERGRSRPDPPPLCHATSAPRWPRPRAARPGCRCLPGGRSFGGRMSSQAQALAPAAGSARTGVSRLPAASGRPAAGTARRSICWQVHIPMLFVQGTRRCAGRAHAAEAGAARLGRACERQWVSGADHSFHVPARSGRRDVTNAAPELPGRSPAAWMASRLMSKPPLERYAAKRTFTPHARARPAAGRRPARGPLLFVVQKHAARRAALRLPPRARRRAQVLGGAQGSLLGSQATSAWRSGRGPPIRLRLLRGRHPGEAVRRRQRDRVGLRRLLPRRRAAVRFRRSRRGRAARARRALRPAS